MSCSAASMARSIQELDERMGRCLGLVERLEQRLEQRLAQCLEGLAIRLDTQFTRRFESLERELQRKASADQCRELVAEAVRPLDAWLEDMAQAACRRPRLLAGPGPEQPPPERRAPARPAQAQPPKGQPAEDCHNGGQRPNLAMSLVVEVRPSEGTGPSAGKQNEVTLEVTASDRISDVKLKALEQLEMWGRFCRIGQLAVDEASSEDEAEAAAAASALPGREACQLYAKEEATNGIWRPLEESKSIRENGVQHGMRLLLASAAAMKGAVASATTKTASPPRRPAPAPAPERAVEEENAAEARCYGGQSGPLNVVVEHGKKEVTIEARTSNSVEFLKCQAHEQLTVWYRFCALSGEEGTEESLPPLEECQLWKSGGPGGASALLQECSLLEDCGLESGQRLVLRALG